MVQRTSNAEAMSMDLSPKHANKAYGSDGGAYYDWSPADLPMLGAASIGAAKLSLAAGGLSLPSYSDSAKVAYVLQGNARYYRCMHACIRWLVIQFVKELPRTVPTQRMPMPPMI